MTYKERQTLKKINAALCNMPDTGGVSSKPEDEQIIRILEEIRDDQRAQPQINGVLPMFLCDINGDKVGYQVIEKDEVTNALQFFYFDMDNNSLATKPAGSSLCDETLDISCEDIGSVGTISNWNQIKP